MKATLPGVGFSALRGVDFEVVSLEEARRIVRSLDVRSIDAYHGLGEVGWMLGLPLDPQKAYTEWTSWRDFLGVPVKPVAVRRRPTGLLKFEPARALARTLGLHSRAPYYRYARENGLPPGVPFRPDVVYGKQFQGWHDFLVAPQEEQTVAETINPATASEGQQQTSVKPRRVRLAASLRAFERTRSEVRSLGLRSRQEFVHCLRSGGFQITVPPNPEAVFRKWFRGWGDFLGVAQAPAAAPGGSN